MTQLCPDLKLAQTSSENDVNRRLMTFTCGHIIPRDNLQPLALPARPTGTLFDFTHAARSDVKVMDELGRVVINASRVAPGGVCIFFLLSNTPTTCTRGGRRRTLSSMLEKDVYREPRDATAWQVFARLRGIRETRLRDERAERWRRVAVRRRWETQLRHQL